MKAKWALALAIIGGVGAIWIGLATPQGGLFTGNSSFWFGVCVGQLLFQSLIFIAVNLFDIEKEPASMRERYGRTVFGQQCLAARRLLVNRRSSRRLACDEALQAL